MNSPFVKLLFLLVVLFPLAACVEKVALNPPKATFVNPSSFQSVASVPAYRKAYAQYEKGDQRKSRAEYQKVLKKTPNHFPSILGIAYTYLAEGNIDFAERYTRRALEFEPAYAQAHFILAYLLEARQQYDEAMQELETVQQLRADYPGAEQARNILRLKATEWHLDEARKLAPSDPNAALEHYRAVLRMAPEVSQVPLEIADLLLRLGRCPEAITFLQDILEQQKNDPELQERLADCYLEEDRLEEALEMYETAAASTPTQNLSDKIEKIRKDLAFRRMPEEYRSIPREEQIHRGQLAALLVTELKFLDRYRASSQEIMVDILNHWAKGYIQKTVDLGIMDVFPNRTFEPQRPVTRIELAKAATRLIQILQASEEEASPEAAQVVIPDVPNSNVYYPLVATALSAGVLSLDGDGRFHPGRTVSGAEALSMVNRLKTLSE